jgi:hypothetical protein
MVVEQITLLTFITDFKKKIKRKFLLNLFIMKTNKIIALTFSLAVMLFITACVEDDDFSTPDLTVAPVDVSSLGEYTTFSNVVARYDTAIANGDLVGVFSVEDDDPLYIEGYVISDDTKGNYYQEIIIQNTINDQNPSDGDVRRGLKVEIGEGNLSGFYNFGRKVYIKLNGLAIAEENGVYTLGKAVSGTMEAIPSYEYKDFVLRDNEVAQITPKIVDIPSLSFLDENTYVQFNDMQFSSNLLYSNYADQFFDEFDGFRTLESCQDGNLFTLQTSTFSDFKSVSLAQGKGSIKGIYTRDFGDDYDVLVVNSLNDITFDQSDRCDPGLIGCTEVSGGGSDLFFEDFQSFGNYASEGWTMTNVDGGNVDWFINGFGGNTYSRISAFGSNEASAEVWLVTPSIDFTTTTGQEFSFDLQANYDSGKGIEVYVSNDFTGDVTIANWSLVQAFIPSGPSDGFGDFETVGPMNISCIDGNVNIAVVYKGSDPSLTTRYHADNFRVTGN